MSVLRYWSSGLSDAFQKGFCEREKIRITEESQNNAETSLALDEEGEVMRFDQKSIQERAWTSPIWIDQN